MKVHELGHLVLYVHDLERSRRFYRDVLGFDGDPPDAGSAASRPPRSAPAAPTTSCCSSRSAPSAAPIPAGRRVGMYHFGLKVGDHRRRAPRGARRRSQADGVDRRRAPPTTA